MEKGFFRFDSIEFLFRRKKKERERKRSRNDPSMPCYHHVQVPFYLERDLKYDLDAMHFMALDRSRNKEVEEEFLRKYFRCH